MILHFWNLIDNPNIAHTQVLTDRFSPYEDKSLENSTEKVDDENEPKTDEEKIKDDVKDDFADFDEAFNEDPFPTEETEFRISPRFPPNDGIFRRDSDPFSDEFFDATIREASWGDPFNQKAES